MKSRMLLVATCLMALVVLAPNANAQFGTIQQGPLLACPGYSPTLAVDKTNGALYTCTDGGLKSPGYLIGAVQSVTATAITDTNFNTLTGGGVKIAGNAANIAGKSLHVVARGIYTTAAASLLNVQIALCQVSGCASGTVVQPAGCVVTTTNQANVLTAGQWQLDCELIAVATGTSATFMAHANAAVSLGAATSAALSTFADTATAVSAAVNLTVDEFVHPQFKFSTSNAGNTATLNQLIVELRN